MSTWDRAELDVEATRLAVALRALQQEGHAVGLFPSRDCSWCRIAWLLDALLRELREVE